jgi:hypothetical protein
MQLCVAQPLCRSRGIKRVDPYFVRIKGWIVADRMAGTALTARNEQTCNEECASRVLDGSAAG